MKYIELTSLVLLSVAVFLMLLLMAGFAVLRYTEHVPIYKAGAEVPSASSVRIIREATNLETLKKICVFWAEQDDRLREYQTARAKQGMLMVDAFVIVIAGLAILFGGGSLYIYILARRLSRAQRNAL